MKAKAGVNLRKKAALKRLIEQLAKGQKPVKDESGKTINNRFVPLTDRDRTRITGEIEILKEKLKGQLTDDNL